MRAKAGTWRRRLGGAAMVVALAGCGNVARGPITALNPFTVGGAVYDARSAAVQVGGAPATLADLGLGMVVTVFAEPDRGGGDDVAMSIEARSELKGLVDAVDPMAGTLVVAGVTVAVDEGTVFEHVAGLDGIQVGDFVEIHGLPGESGDLVATRVEVEREDGENPGDDDPGDDDPAEGEIEGLVEAVDPVAGTLAIAGVTVVVDAGTVWEHLSGLEDLAVGDRVEVHGLRGDDGSIAATRIERESEGDDDHDDDREDDHPDDDGSDDDDDHDDHDDDDRRERD